MFPAKCYILFRSIGITPEIVDWYGKGEWEALWVLSFLYNKYSGGFLWFGFFIHLSLCISKSS